MSTIINSFRFYKKPATFCLLVLGCLFSSLKGRAQEDIFIKVIPSKTSVYKGEAFTLSVNLFHRIPIIDPGDELKLDIKDAYIAERPRQLKNGSASINGIKYDVVTLKDLLVIPQSEGYCTIPAIRTQVKLNSTVKDDFFESEKIVSRKLTSPEVSIKVKPLPPLIQNLPFSGAVGDFRIESKFKVDPKKPDILDLVVQVSGKGNLRYLNMIAPELPDGLTLVGSGNSESHTIKGSDLFSTNTFKFSLFSPYRNVFKIQRHRILAFDPRKEKYYILEIPEYSWNVTSGKPFAGRLQSQVPKKTGPAVFILNTQLSHSASGNGLMNIMIFCAGGLLYILSYFIRKRSELRVHRPVLHKFRMARSVALREIKRLQRSEKSLNAGEYSRRTNAILFNYFEAKLNLNGTYLTSSSILRHLELKDFPKKQTEFLQRTFDILDFARFSPMEGKSSIVCSDIKALITSLDACFNEKDIYNDTVATADC